MFGDEVSTSAFADLDIKEIRADLLHIPPPYLLRKYGAVPEDFETLAEENLKCEYLNGVLIVHSPATWFHEDLVGFLITLLRIHATRAQLGSVCGSNAVMQVGELRFCPDISFLKNENRNRIRGGRIMGPMDLAIEVLSQSTRDYDLGDKRKAYREGLVPEIWLIDPERKEAHFDLFQGGRYVTQLLSRGDVESRVLVGFNLRVDWLWQDPLPDPLACLEIRV